MSWYVGVDVGGTFTDFYTFDDATGESFVHKTPSTPDNPARAIVTGLQDLCAARGIAVAAVARLAHGTTVATNALLQRRGGKVALITTQGFRDLIEIGRQIRPHMYDLQVDHPQPLVPREWRVEVAERVTADGGVRQPLGERDLAAAVAAIKAMDAEATAVCLLFAFVNPDHERRLGAALAEAMPERYVSLSSEVQPEFREYERLSTTVLNAYLQPVMARYIGDLERQIQAIAPAVNIGINQSSGGLMSIERARQFPIRTALSGPAAGAIGAIHVARLAGRPDVITLDMGGTSADICLIRDHATGTGFDRSVGGFPVRMPMMDINTIGAGGGSIAWFDRDGLMKVGPISAGAAPGPACYGGGGTQATVTDANLVLGRLSPRGLLGGRMTLDRAAAAAAHTPLAARLGFTVERTAHGLLSIVVSNMVRAIRTVSVERGHDPRRFSLMPFGGAGALHATDVARTLGIAEILVPPAPGILCAQGLVVSDLKEDFVRTARTALDDRERPLMLAKLADLRADAAHWFGVERVEPADRTTAVTFDMRYVGQNFELAVDIGTADPLPDAAALRRLFFAAHERSYGFFNEHDPVEIINYRLVARGRLRRPEAPRHEPATGEPVPLERRLVWFDADAPVDTPVYDRAQLAPGHRITGPAVIEQLDATTLVYPRDRMTVDPVLNLLIETQP
ncbi:MAG: hydantoinase/oxoprolinase family protein [Pseudomonadota bacterium]